MQTALAFYLCVLVGYGPTIDLAAARDRLVGVLLGNLIVWLVFTNIWPESTADKACLHIAAALRKFSHLLSQHDFGAGRPPERSDSLIFEFNSALAQAARFLSFSPHEAVNAYGKGPIRLRATAAGAVQSLLGPALVLDGERQPDPNQLDNAEVLLRHSQITARLLTLVQQLSGKGRESSAGPSKPPPIPARSKSVATPYVAPLAAREVPQVRGVALAAWRQALAERAQTLDALVRE
jgi:multidrug resistance protein MdtO